MVITLLPSPFTASWKQCHSKPKLRTSHAYTNIPSSHFSFVWFMSATNTPSTIVNSLLLLGLSFSVAEWFVGLRNGTNLLTTSCESWCMSRPPGSSSLIMVFAATTTRALRYIGISSYRGIYDTIYIRTIYSMLVISH